MTPLGRVVLGSLLALIAYSDAPLPRTHAGPTTRALSAKAPPPSVEYSGCKRVVSGPRCEIGDDAAITLWMPASFQNRELAIDERRQHITDRVVAGGYQAQIPIPSGSRELTLASGGQIQFRLPFNSYRPEPLLEAAERAKDEGDYPRALELAQRFRDGPSALDRWVSQGIEARVHLRAGRIEQASVLLESTTHDLFRAGQVSLATRDMFARFFVLLHRQFDLEKATEWFARHRSAASTYPLGRALVRENDGILAASSGEISAALHATSLAARDYERLGHQRDVRRVQFHRATLFSELGQTAQAEDQLKRLMPPLAEEDACIKAHMYMHASWFMMLRVQEGASERGPEVLPLFRQADEWTRACSDPETVTVHLVNQGLWALDQDDSLELHRMIRALRGRSRASAPYLESWIAELQGRAALREQRLEEALTEFRSELASAERAGDWDAKLRALLGLADVEQARGDPRAAARHLEAASSALVAAQRFAPFGELAHSQHAARQRAAQRLVEALVARGHSLEAYRAALTAYQSALAAQAHSRDLEVSSPEVRQRFRALLGEYRRRRNALDHMAGSDWKLTGAQQRVRDAERRDELAELALIVERATKLLPESGARTLPEPEPGEFQLLLFPTRQGWSLFGVSDAGVELAGLSAAEIESAETTHAPTHPALAPFVHQLRAARSIVLMPAGASRRWPFERWKLDGQALDQRPIAFSAGLPRRRPAPRSSSTAAVISDPTGDLPIARREGQMVATALQISEPRALVGERATVSHVLAAFDSVDHLHFAGHAHGADQPGGARIVLADRADLEAWEFFGLPSVPRHVVLSACYSGSSPAQGLGVGWGLAQVLLALGAETVIAPQGTLRDGDAYAFQKLLYEQLKRGAPLREAFWHARRSTSEDGTGDRSFRLFVR